MSSTTANRRIGWTSPFEDPPEANSHCRDVVDYLDGEILPIFWWAKGRDPYPAEFHEFCDAKGYDWARAKRELRRRRALAARPADQEARFDTTPAGIKIDIAKMAVVAGQWAPMCPFKLSFVSTETLRDFHLDAKCGSWCCEICAPEKADRLLHQVGTRLGDLELVYVAVVTYDPSLMTRMAQRRRASGMNTFWYRLIDDTVAFVGDQPITGTVEPTSSTPMTPDDALDWLRSDIMWLPGHQDHGFSAGWTFKQQASGSERTHVSMAGLDDSQIAEVTQVVASEIEAEHQVHLNTGFVPPALREEVARRLREERDRLLGGADGT